MKIKIPKELIDLGYISVQKHTEADYFIYNYTPKTMFEGKWNEFTMQCRGLILNSKNVVIARPFEKFFNLSEYDKLAPDFLDLGSQSCEVFEKIDGSLGILYHLPSGEPRIATRGSFTSEQAIEANKIFNEKYRAFEFDTDYTFLFEIIYPSNRIVVDYGGMRDLVLLGAINKETGEEAPFSMLQEYSLLMQIPLIDVYQFKNVDAVVKFMQEEPKKNSEGYVLKFSEGLRIKVKYDEYVRLHKLVTGVNAKTIWEILKENQSMDDLLAYVPDEFYDWVDKTAKGLINQFNGCERMCQVIIKEEICQDWDMGTIARMFNEKYPNESGVLFAMYRGKEYKQIIWKLIKPKFAKAFRCNE